MGAKKAKTPSHDKEAAKYDPNEHVMVVASKLRACLTCGRHTAHKKNTCKES